MVLILAIGGTWWVVHGQFSRLALAQLLGSLSLLLAIALGCESMHVGWSEPLTALQWIGQERVTWLTMVGGVGAMLATAYLALGQFASPRPTTLAMPITTQRADQFMIKHLVMAGCALLLMSASLTVLASCLPLGPTPFGGQWSAGYLGFYGLFLSGLGIALERNQRLVPAVAIVRLIASLICPWG